MSNISGKFIEYYKSSFQAHELLISNVKTKVCPMMIPMKLSGSSIASHSWNKHTSRMRIQNFHCETPYFDMQSEQGKYKKKLRSVSELDAKIPRDEGELGKLLYSISKAETALREDRAFKGRMRIVQKQHFERKPEPPPKASKHNTKRRKGVRNIKKINVIPSSNIRIPISYA